MHTHDSSSHPSSSPMRTLFTPTSATKLLANIYSHTSGSSGLRRKKKIASTDINYDSRGPSIHEQTPHHEYEPDSDSEPFSYRNLFLTQFQQLKKYQYAQQHNKMRFNRLDHYSSTSSSSSNNKSSIETALHSLLHMILIFMMSLIIIGTVFIVMYTYLTHDYTYRSDIQNSSSVSNSIHNIFIMVMSFITSMVNLETPNQNDNWLLVYLMNFTMSTTTTSSSISSDNFLCTIKINMISRQQ